MRKDVKVGLAVGGILFGVVLAYALFFTGDNKRQVADRGRSTPPAQPAAEPAAAHETVAPPANPGRVDIVAPEPSSSGVLPLTRTPPLPAPPAMGSAEGTTPTTPAPSPAGPTPSEWSRLLDGPSTPALGQSSTPSTLTPLPGQDNAAVTPPVVPPTTPGTTVDPIAPVPPTTPSDPITPPPADGPRSYVVKQGDNYWKISVAEYGSGQYVAALMQANPRYPATKLRQGVTITIPAKSEVVPSGVAIAHAGRIPTTRPVDSVTQYRVKSGDNLYIISKRLYGRADKAERIYELNKEVIGPNPNALKLGTLLQLPEPPATMTTNNTAASATGSDLESLEIAQ